MPKKIILVSCVSMKNSFSCSARDLYQSDWNNKFARYASQRCVAWYILSAKHGLGHTDQILDPYNETLKTMGKGARKAWAQKVMEIFRLAFNQVIGINELVSNTNQPAAVFRLRYWFK